MVLLSCCSSSSASQHFANCLVSLPIASVPASVPSASHSAIASRHQPMQYSTVASADANVVSLVLFHHCCVSPVPWCHVCQLFWAATSPVHFSLIQSLASGAVADWRPTHQRRLKSWLQLAGLPGQSLRCCVWQVTLNEVTEHSCFIQEAGWSQPVSK